MFGLGFWEILIILVVALLVLGPERLPEAAKTLGRSMAQLRHAADDIREELTTTKKDLEHSLADETPAEDTQSASSTDSDDSRPEKS